MKKNNITEPVIFSIFKIHSKRIGYFRTLTGALLMYLTLPFFIFLHISVVVFLYKIIFLPLLQLKKLSAKNYIILDRYDIPELSIFDRLNCLFCGYVNGIILLMNAEIDQVANSANVGFMRSLLIMVFFLPITVFLILGMILATIIVNILFKLFGLHRGSYKIVLRQLINDKYASQCSPLKRKIVIFYKTIANVIAYNLEQIESSWCPITHLERNGYVFPEHHKNFYSRNNLQTMKNVLITKKTVSNNPPKF